MKKYYYRAVNSISVIPATLFLLIYFSIYGLIEIWVDKKYDDEYIWK
jgi:hypothetical protein